ncbi:MAG: hypothetical protein E7375_00860 [Clostridiales bacterium]|nr:hypothetical protein [Clostridiales bacterium]
MFNFFNEVKQNIKSPIEDFNIINMSGQILYVEGHKGLIVLSKEEIVFKIKKGTVSVFGENMLLAELNQTTIKICGKIKKVEQN